MDFDERKRAMYAGGRPGPLARVANRVDAWLGATGLLGCWCVRLTTINPKSGTSLTRPLVTAEVDDRRFLVSMLGQGARWVRNVRAAEGEVVITVGRRHPVRLVEVPVSERAPILQNYLQRPEPVPTSQWQWMPRSRRSRRSPPTCRSSRSCRARGIPRAA